MLSAKQGAQGDTVRSYDGCVVRRLYSTPPTYCNGVRALEKGDGVRLGEPTSRYAKSVLSRPANAATRRAREANMSFFLVFFSLKLWRVRPAGPTCVSTYLAEGSPGNSLTGASLTG